MATEAIRTRSTATSRLATTTVANYYRHLHEQEGGYWRYHLRPEIDPSPDDPDRRQRARYRHQYAQGRSGGAWRADAAPINLFYDFIPATGQVVSSSDETRSIVDVPRASVCHGQFTWRSGDALDGAPVQRQDTRYCVVCHGPAQVRARGRHTIAGGPPPTPPAIRELLIG
jgi:hypothetical protein